MEPKVSVIIATYYRNELVTDAIESVLAQEYDPIELVVVDDSGEGHAEPVLRQYDEVTPIIREENGGWGAAYTTGIRASTGEYVQLLDDDDILLPGKLERTAEVLRDDPDVGVAYCGMVQDNGTYHYPNPEVTGNVLEEALRFKTFPCCTITMLVDRDVLVDTLPLAGYGDDLDLKIELARRTEFDTVDECLVGWRRRYSRKWVGLQKYEEMKRIVRNQRDIYREHPEIRRDVLAERYEKEGQERLDERCWSAAAILCFLKAAYHGDETALRCTGQAVAALLGRPGLNAARCTRNAIWGPPPRAVCPDNA